MTKKDYVRFAEMIRFELWLREPEITPRVRSWITVKIADIFAHDSPRFDRDKFYADCEPKNR